MINMKTPLNLVCGLWGVFGDLVDVGGGRSNRASLHCVILLLRCFFVYSKKSGIFVGD
jgi:hypothetical protein